MDGVYIVQHENPTNDDVKFIGVYSSRELAAEAVLRMIEQPGFRDFPENFHIGLYEINEDHWTEGFVSVKY